MAFDGKGKYHMNPHHAKMADGFNKKGKPADDGDGEEEAEDGMKDETKPGPDGETADGSEVPELLQELHSKHGGKHMHVHAHDAGVTTHHIGEDGAVEGPHHHASMEEAAQHMHSVMGDQAEATPEMPMHSGHPMMAGY